MYIPAVIYYTLDGTDPTRDSTVYEGPFTVSESCIVKAFAVAASYGDSTIARKLYNIE